MRESKVINGVLHLMCAHCKTFFPASTDYFEKVSRAFHGYGSYCCFCRKKINKAYRPARGIRLKPAQRQRLYEGKIKAEAALKDFLKRLDLLTKANNNGG